MKHMRSAIDHILSQILSAEVVYLAILMGTMSVPLDHATYHAVRGEFDLTMANGLTQLVVSSKRLSNVDNHNVSLLDLLLT